MSHTGWTAVTLLSAAAIALAALAWRPLARAAVARKRLRSFLHHSPDILTAVDESTSISFMSSSAQRILGWDPRRLRGTRFLDLVHPDDARAAMQTIADTISEPGSYRSAVWRVKAHDGTWRFLDTTLTDLRRDRSVRGILINSRDISDRAALEADLTFRAFHDPLTRLPNRARFRAEVERALERAADRPESIAVLFLDLDDFKDVNDRLGHAEGDRLLTGAATRLLHATRGIDTVARIGGDEFAVIADRINTDADAEVVAQRIIEAMRVPFALAASESICTVSVGVARGRIGETVDDIMRNADIAMYNSKKRGKNQLTFYRPAMDEVVRRRQNLGADLRQACEREELTLLFQPIVSFADETMAGVEALIRWNRGNETVSPAEFIPLAEDLGLMPAIGRWILREACRYGAHWQRLLPPQRRLWISVNISDRQLRGDELLTDLREAMTSSGLRAEDLVLEVSERIVMQDHDAALRRLMLLRDMGVRLALDDFGTGYSSLSSLQRLPIQMLKVDRSFVEAACSEGTGQALAQSIIALGHALKLETVAEGVEHRRHARTICSLGADFAQGYYFSRPVGPLAIEAVLTGGPAGVRALEPLELVRGGQGSRSSAA